MANGKFQMGGSSSSQKASLLSKLDSEIARVAQTLVSMSAPQGTPSFPAPGASRLFQRYVRVRSNALISS
jgi:hypothetical protein